MRTLISILFVFLLVNANAQKSPVEKFIKNNAYETGIDLQEIDPQHTEYPAELKVDGAPVREHMAQIESIKIINCSPEATSVETREKFYTKGLKALQDKKYLEMINIYANDETFNVYTYQKKKDVINEFVVLMKDGEEVSMLYIKGEVDLRSLELAPFISALTKGKSCGEKKTGGE